MSIPTDQHRRLEHCMTRHLLTVPALLIAAAWALPDVGAAQAFKVAKFNIGGDGGTDYLTAEPGTGRVFVSRGTHVMVVDGTTDRKSTRLNSSHLVISYAVFCLKQKKKQRKTSHSA